MSTDASLFPIHFFDCDMFCEKCAQIEKFKIFSQKKYDKHYGKNEIPPNRPLFCRCEKCGSTIIYTTNEFAELQEEPTFGLCKIWGLGNLEPGDLVFHPKEQICTVENVNKIRDSLPQVTLRNKNKDKIEIQVDSLTEDENGNAFYRLHPQNSYTSRIGDWLYNTETGLAGKVTGLEFNGVQAIIIMHDDGKFAKYICNNSYYLTDKLLEANARWRCRHLPYSRNLQISSSSKILSVSCTVPNLSAVCELKKIIASIPQARSSIVHIVVENTNPNPNTIYMELIKNCIYICCCHVEVENQIAYISGFYSDINAPKNVKRVLSKFALKKINLDIKMRTDIKTVKTINEADHFIRISKMGKDLHIDGWVKNEKEKKKAKRKAFFLSLSFRIENHLLVME